ncbi:sigma-E processing peptidase SpoIIGA [Halobacillus sp. A1]|uniref:sigma-E processing peptidase SpoIIGA n=1 Tax=Halobacillus sp. A1 TaxID=2880262 RepID=UPI0020A644CC|nr:sigma-E processing peptidase SpoIIGA [Halobacillus sp. A1]
MGRIYLDAVWMLNLLMDGMILYLTQGLTRAKTSNFRIFAAALIASSIVPITVLQPDLWLASTLGKTCFSILIIFAAFSFVSFRSLLIQWLTFYFVTFAIGGTLVGIHFLFSTPIEVNGGQVITYSTGFGDPFSWLFVCIGFPVSWLFTKWRMEQIQAHRLKTEDLYRVKVVFNNNSIMCTGLVDSGNHLFDPISKRMVFLADRNLWRNFLPDETLNQLVGDEMLDALEQLPDPFKSSVQLIPFQGAGSSGQLMVTFLVDSIIVFTEEGELRIEKPLVGIQDHDLTFDRMYQILIHPHASLKGISA